MKEWVSEWGNEVTGVPLQPLQCVCLMMTMVSAFSLFSTHPHFHRFHMHKQKSVDKRPITFWLVMTSEDRTEQQQQQHQALSDHHHHHRHHHLNYCLHYIRHNITRTELALLHHSTPEANSHFGNDKTHTHQKRTHTKNYSKVVIKKMSVAAADQISSNIDKWCLLRQQHNYKAKNCRKLKKN